MTDAYRLPDPFAPDGSLMGAGRYRQLAADQGWQPVQQWGGVGHAIGNDRTWLFLRRASGSVSSPRWAFGIVCEGDRTVELATTAIEVFGLVSQWANEHWQINQLGPWTESAHRGFDSLTPGQWGEGRPHGWDFSDELLICAEAWEVGLGCR